MSKLGMDPVFYVGCKEIERLLLPFPASIGRFKRFGISRHKIHSPLLSSLLRIKFNLSGNGFEGKVFKSNFLQSGSQKWSFFQRLHAQVWKVLHPELQPSFNLSIADRKRFGKYFLRKTKLFPNR